MSTPKAIRARTTPTSRRRAPTLSLPKAPSGIAGLDEITDGGLPRGRPTLICGGAGCGKTLFGLEFLVRGATRYDEPGVFVAFEESQAELAANVASLGFDLDGLVAQKRIFVDYVRVERSEIEETGEYDLEGLFVRLAHAIRTVRAKRVVLDTVEALFAGLPSPHILRSELRRLFRWLKDRGMTVVLTGEKGDGTLTRHGLEEYVSDCVIFLDHRVTQESSTRRLRVVKYRGSTHGTNEFPFLIDSQGISILPVTSLGLAHQAGSERVSTGIDWLDRMLGGKGYYRGSSVMVSGTAGTGKTSLVAAMVAAACCRGERCLMFALEESAEQIARNLRSVGIDLHAHLAKGLLRILAARPTAYGLETHLVAMHKAVEAFAPRVVVVDPITSLMVAGSPHETQAMLTRLVDFLKVRGVTTCLTSLVDSDGPATSHQAGISSLIDTWLMLAIERAGQKRRRTLTVVKSRGMAHSDEVTEYRMGNHGFERADGDAGGNGRAKAPIVVRQLGERLES